ncbi:hypothetical protein IQ238_13240 [Pleurocapsales cyanobacterium LEGE 06147]|nr:hypothetical protein [Pleurocapsales cyanobacterium LEGE 06147]
MLHFKAFIKLCLMMSLIYITLGDLFLPQPYRNNSKKVRKDINEFVVSLLPKKDFINLQRPQENLQKVEKGRFNSPL